ncbi:hypothetical protein JCM10207_004696 [Rhodosporidiobolus poonsookiae]
MHFSPFLPALLLLAAPLVSAHPRSSSLRHRGRSMPRRLDARAEGAVVKCSADGKTFQMCDGERCGKSSAVATGTVCKDGYLTWDTTDETATEDSASASSSTVSQELLSSASSSLVGATSERTSSSSAETTSDVAALAPSSATSMRARKSNFAGASKASSSAKFPSAGTTLPAAVTTTASAEATTSSSSSATIMTSTSTAKSSSVQATTSSSSAPAASSSGSSSSSGVFTGLGTVYDQYGVAGACGKTYSDDDLVIALSAARYAASGSSNSNTDCGRSVEITNTDTWETVTAVVADLCPGCDGYDSLDLSRGVWTILGDDAAGHVPISWSFSS